jgi:hypothetical protein
LLFTTRGNMSTILQIFRDIAPEFVLTNDATVTRFIGYVTNQVDSTLFGSDYGLAIAYLAADMLSISLRSGATTGMIDLKREGELSLGYAVPDDKSYVTTYGQKFLQLRKMHVTAALVTNYTGIIVQPWWN